MPHVAASITPQQRAARLQQTRNLKMARSAHAYVRGSTARFYDWLEAGDHGLPDGPAVWICGDCHLGNLGPLADAKGRVAIQIRDLDQTVIGNPAHDLVRLGLSLASAARGSDLSGVTTARMMEALVAGYEGALQDGAAEIAPPKRVRALLKRSTSRRWRHLAEERLQDARPSIPLGKRFWALTKKERRAIEAMVADEAVTAMITGLKGRKADAPVELLDAAYWMKGCSSLGRLRYAVLVRVGRGEGGEVCLIDVKEAATAAAPRAANAAMPRDNAARVVAGARALSPNLGQRMVAARLLDRGVVLRELMPQDLKLEADRMSHAEAADLAGYLAAIVGRAHARQMDDEARRGWLHTLAARRSTQLDAPSWLWSSVVDLLGAHEAAYLDHCRLYALSADTDRAAA